MPEAVEPRVNYDNFLEFLKTLPWCRQGDSVLVAVHKCTPEIIEVLGQNELKVFPGGMNVKMNKSWLLYLEEKHEEGLPIPLLLVWRAEAIELWYRRHKPWDFPYDTWNDPVAAAYERERVRVLAETGGPRFAEYHREILSRAKECPSTLPAQ